MTHYVYYIRNDKGYYYIGSRSCDCEPAKDPYMGSGRWPVEQIKKGVALTKRIHRVFRTRREACDEERRLISEFIDDSFCMNLSKCTAVPSFEWKNPLLPIVTSGMMDAGPLSVCLWIEVVASSGTFGISTAVLARRNKCTIPEAQEALARISKIIPENLPQIKKSGNIWKAQ